MAGQESITFKSFVVDEHEGRFRGHIQTKTLNDLPEHDLLIKVHYSALNYKDALSASGNKGVTKSYPHTPGIDAVGTVIRSESEEFQKNDIVTVTGYDFGMNTSGGFSQYIQIPSDWAIKLPAALSMKASMTLGTAGLTAGMSILKLLDHVKPSDGEVVVSGATGGVGSLSVAILAKLGFTVCAISGKKEDHNFLLNLGAGEVIDRETFAQENTRPMLKSRFAGGIDTVGGSVLENMIKSTNAMGAITCCGNVASPKLNLTVFPFILRGIALIGIDSQNLPLAHRKTVWDKLASDWHLEDLNELSKEISLNELDEHIQRMLEGKIKGRTILNLDSE